MNCPSGMFSGHRAVSCSSCPAFSESGIGNATCKCNAGYFESTRRGSVAFGSGYLDTLYVGKWVANPPYITVSGSMNLMIARGSIVSFTAQPFMGASSGLQLYSNLFDVYQDVVLESSYIFEFTHTTLEHITATASYPQSQAFVYSTGVSGQNSTSLVWDTAHVPSGLYFLMPTVGSTIRYALDVFVASPTPVTLTYRLYASADPSQNHFNPVAACMGDTIVLDKASSIQSAANIVIICFPRGPMAHSDLVFKVSGAAPVSWTVDAGAGNSQCLIGMNVYNRGLRTVGVLRIYNRPTGSTSSIPVSWSEFACASCAPGYRSSKGASNCTACERGQYSANAAAVSCTRCPAFTTSIHNASASLLDCVCLPGYTCAYTKRIHVVIRVRNATASQFNHNRSAFLAAVAKAAGVGVSQVTVLNVTEASRRLMPGGGDDVYHLEVVDAVRVDTAALHSRGIAVTWAPAHALRVRRLDAA